MAKVLSLKLKEEIFNDAEKMVKEMKIPRNTYINHAIEYYTRFQKKRLLRKRYKKDSALARESSTEVLREFEAFMEDYE